MGHPKFHRSKFARPQKPYDKNRLTKEKGIMQQFGLRTKHELWRSESILRDFRARARNILAEPNQKAQEELFSKINKIGIKAEKLEDILGINIESLLSRRLQTILVRRGFVKSTKQARQLIVHNHVLVGDQKVRWPSYLVPADLESKIDIEADIKAKLIDKGAKS